MGELEKIYQTTETKIGAASLRNLEKNVMLQNLDMLWKEHLAAMDYLRQGIHLRGYAQKNPKQEYKREAFELFSGMLDNLKNEVISQLSKIDIQRAAPTATMDIHTQPTQVQYFHPNLNNNLAGQVIMPESVESQSDIAIPTRNAAGAVLPFARKDTKVGRNETCPCGSGKKYKHCHGQL